MSTSVSHSQGQRQAAPHYRFGAGDERGALNLIDAGAVRRGFASVVEARVISLAQPIRAGAVPIANMRSEPIHYMMRDGGDYAAGLPERPGLGYADDALLVACHGTTHLDALGHVWQDGKMYGGFSADEVTSRGARRCGIEKAGPFVCRGWLVDPVRESGQNLAAGTPISVETLQRSLDGCDVQPGDALIIRTAWVQTWQEDSALGNESWPGLGLDCIDWILERGFAMVGSDNLGVEVSPSTDPNCASPLHIALMRDHGIYFLELLDLEDLSHALFLAGRQDFLLVVAPLRIHQASGSPVAPVAVI